MNHNRQKRIRNRQKSNKRTGMPRVEIIYGHHPVVAAITNPERKLAKLLITIEAQKNLIQTLLRREKEILASETPQNNLSDVTKAKSVVEKAQLIERAQLASLLPEGSVHQGLLLECAPLPSKNLIDFTPSANNAPLIILDQINDPHNIGAILRSAAAFGALAVVVQARYSPGTSGVIAKAASGALETVPIVREVNIARAIQSLQNMGYWVVGLDANSERVIRKGLLKKPIALVLGAEGSGLRQLTKKSCDILLKIQLGSAVDSLNVSNAAAISLYELSMSKNDIP